VFDEDEKIFKAIKAGADGYLLKEIDAESLHNAILEVLDGGAPMTPSIALKALKLLRNPQDFNETKELDLIKLTSRETEILEQISKGLQYGSIAENLFISTGTVRKHIENIYRKLQVHNKIEAVHTAKKHRII
jgi:DNA-binding NarL/FixJ family response regulator